MSAVDEARAALDTLLNSLGIVGPNIIHAEQGMYPDGKHSHDDTWDGPGWCVCGRVWPCEALATIAATDALIAAVRAEIRAVTDRAEQEVTDLRSDPTRPPYYMNGMEEVIVRVRAALERLP